MWQSATSVHRDESHVILGRQLAGDPECPPRPPSPCRRRHEWRRRSGLQTSWIADTRLRGIPSCRSCALVIRLASATETADLLGSAKCINDPIRNEVGQLRSTNVTIPCSPDRCIDVDQMMRGNAGGGVRTRTAMGQGVLSALCLPIPSRPRVPNAITAVPRGHRPPWSWLKMADWAKSVWLFPGRVTQSITGRAHADGGRC